ncbi:hypothetical protein [Virgisporangium aurantiacum]|uniref:Intracellular proteinase inhibitor BsuPI domain-containing protein n=1 Tax=Virgisporangium aurantiacum TaxID=175570 RepID=A0A8J3YYF3_9ACTN|nr:hypothetical protein [Virgisporangium aurantiacum]GIJ54031.1 hypothetical protein Vau01_015470 [Virgisporangium aurantiacum]
MRLTVGPLSPNVYWRRRAVVLAGVLVFVLIIAYSCSGDDEPGKKPTANNPTTTGAPTETSTAQALPTITPNASDPTSGRPVTGGGGTGVTGEGANGETCTDTELLVTAAAENASVRQGVPVTFFIRIKNVSTRTCSRDVSAQAQELYLEQNSAKQWSSDTCSNASNAADVRRMQPNDSPLQFNVPWNGQGTAQGCTNRKLLNPGTYQLRARLGNIVSEPVTVTVNA